ncbi:MAG: exodeoxyribonuclease VII small subunit [Sulfuricurvum sp.]|jgi:exodeoxyribonuclease VII small subunit
MEETVSFEVRISKAKTILEKLMDPTLPMDESVKAYQQGMDELKEAQKMLETAQVQIQIIKNQEH